MGLTVPIRTPWGWRDSSTGRWTHGPSLPGPSFTILLAKKQLWRFSYGVTFVEHGNYYGAILQAWSTSRRLLEDSRTRLVAILKTAVSDYVGFDDWEEWGFVKADGEGFQQVPYDRSLDGSWEWWVEDDKGVALRHEKGDVS